MTTIASLSLSGGQGKTSIFYFLALELIANNFKVLVVDLDPQHSLTDFFAVKITETSPSCYEFLTGDLQPIECVYEVSNRQNLWIVPSDDGLEKANTYLEDTGYSVFVLKQRLNAIAHNFDFILIDTPPQKLQLFKTAIGACDRYLIPVETTSKGVGSLARTRKAIAELASICNPSCLGVVPFRDRWIGANQSLDSRNAVVNITNIMGKPLVLPSIIESEQSKKAIDNRKSHTEWGYPDLAYPFQIIKEKLVEVDSIDRTSKTPVQLVS